MGFYNNNRYYTTIDLAYSDIYQNVDKNGNKLGIEIVNNEETTFTAKDFLQSNNEINLIELEKTKDFIEKERNTLRFRTEKDGIRVEDCLYKIFIDYQDGHTDTFTRPILGKDREWLTFTHRFRFRDNKFVKEKDTDKAPGTIKVKLYNLYGFTNDIEIPFSIRQTSMQEQGIELNLVNANIDNNKNISYIFNNIGENQLLLARNKNKR